MFNKEVVEKYLDKYPQLEISLLSGVVSMKMVRELIGVDRWLMQDIYKDLMVAGAVRGTSSTYFKASKDCVSYLQERIVAKAVAEDKK